jgi:1,4-alpha-glucan branching enzyme/maltooligosyltrehalose trehalohydrolase
LVLENDENVANLLDLEDPPRGKYRAQWNDDYHHAWHVLLTGEIQGYYGDYSKSPLKDIARALGSGFVYQGEPSAHRNGLLRGECSRMLPPVAMVNFLQNHDQIGNRAIGDRLESIVSPRTMEAALEITWLARMIPMLFMGEEWGSEVPYPSFAPSKATLRRLFARADERNLLKLMPSMATKFPTLWMNRRFALQSWIGRHAIKSWARSDLGWCNSCFRSDGMKSFHA